MGKELLLEIGTEEIPAAFLPKALKDMEAIFRKELATHRIPHGEIRTLGAPRRLLLAAKDIADRQEDQLVEKLGPAKRVAFDDAGRPSQAALGFAKGQGLAIEALCTVTTEKGEYLCARKEIVGAPTDGLLPAIVTKVITEIPFRKSMRWSDLDFRFARPIHWILALFGGQIIPLTIAGIESGHQSRGHRFMSPDAFAVSGLDDYLARTRERFVIVDPAERKRIIAEEIAKAAAAVDGRVFTDEALLDEVTFLTEYPTVVCGSFDPEYLRLPREVLITTMMSHQKYFPVLDAKGALLPHFLTVNNTLARDPAVVRRGNERVIRARLADARFFFEEDRKVPLERRVEGLQKVVFHTLLGTSYEKVVRFQTLAARIAGRIAPDLTAQVERAAWLAKADLDTQMVCEFAELQGIMGREYALLAGEDAIVARAIHEHYLPTAAGGDLPETDVGAIVGIADKIDTICGFFGVGLIPTGTADPYALRRQALGVIAIILNRGYRLPLPELLDESLAILGPLAKRSPAEIKADVLEFFRGRFENQLISQGHPYDVVDAVLATGAGDLVLALKKIQAMAAFKSHPDFEPLAVAFKRAVNITKDFPGGAIDSACFATSEEKELYAAYQGIRRTVEGHLEAGDYPAALTALAGLRKPVDAFFGAVLVMDKDERVRLNRLALLGAIAALFHGVADFSRIVTEA
ncbi:MAG: glycine--tRNA ligase subunit beta [Deltaproteobacteria bacterium]|nr:glycine--tRNA ligase subunit beta [Deltaproteobacteria bacterium]